eukprot:RCo010979
MAPFALGLSNHVVPMALHALNRSRLCKAFQQQSEGLLTGSFVLLQGGQDQARGSTDYEPTFRQESYFHWAFGVWEPGFYGVIDLNQNKATLFMPRLPESYAIWAGEIQPPSFFKDKYEVDEVVFADGLAAWLKAAKAAVLYVLKGKNTDSGQFYTPASFPEKEQFRVDDGRLFPLITELRVRKTPLELDV